MAENLSKKEIRSECIARRNALPADIRSEKSSLICGALAAYLDTELFAQMPDKKPSVIAAYYPLGSEVDIRGLYGKLKERKCSLCLPVMISEKGSQTMKFYFIPFETVEEGRADFLAKPARALKADAPALIGLEEADPSLIDAVVVPMVAFNENNVRLGYGGGNYDRFLPKLRENALMIGAAFEEQEDERIPAEEHDFALPIIITDRGRRQK